MMFALLVTGCGSDNSVKPVDNPDVNEPPEIKLGMIVHLNATEQKLKEIYDTLIKNAGLYAKLNTVKFYDNLNTMQMGLDSGDVNEISVYKCVSDYLAAINDKYTPANENSLSKLSDSFCFAMRKDDAELKAQLDKAIDEMKSDGTLDNLVKTYITDIKPENIPAVEIPMVDGDETLKVGITGDLPPLDFVTADGKPAGFNTAMLAEIAKRIDRNVEIVQINSGARAAALNSNQIDVAFWAIIPASNDMPPTSTSPKASNSVRRISRTTSFI